MNITDKTLLVTGANRGLGQALVEEVGTAAPPKRWGASVWRW